MIGRPDWFRRRKYGGWGISPKTWQGWAYMLAVILPFVIFNSLPYWDNATRLYVTAGWLAFLFLDVGHIMFTLKRDEMEEKIEAVAERNTAWVMVFALVIGIFYQVISSGLADSFYVDPFLVAALFLGMIVKTFSNIVLERRGV